MLPVKKRILGSFILKNNPLYPRRRNTNEKVNPFQKIWFI
jgi:hypothetical protein